MLYAYSKNPFSTALKHAHPNLSEEFLVHALLVAEDRLVGDFGVGEDAVGVTVRE